MIPSMSEFTPSLMSLLDITSLISKVQLAYNVAKIPIGFKDKFFACNELAKQYGKLLANCLILQFPFVNQSVSLFGFVLGAQVLYSCLEELYSKRADNIVHNVYFIGGAVNSSDHNKWAKVLSVVRGTVYNYYSHGDKSLYAYKTVTQNSPIGMKALLTIKNEKNNMKEKERVDRLRDGLRIVNVDTTRNNIDDANYKDDLERNWPQIFENMQI